MPTNVTPQYQKAEEEYFQADTTEDKLKCLKNMLALAPDHKSSQKLRSTIKQKISKLKTLQEKQKKKSGPKLGFKKEGAATIAIIGTPNSGKSTLLKELTNAKVEIAPYKFTTKKPEVGTLDYKGIKLQLVEIPAITKNYQETIQGPKFLSIVRSSDLLILCYKTEKGLELIKRELKEADINLPYIHSNEENIEERIWNTLDLIKIYTKQPGKKKSFPPVALKKGSTIRDFAKRIHKDFEKKFKFARVFGPSAKFPGQKLGPDHELKDEDAVELHLK